MELILKNGILYDPAQEINGEKVDIMVKDGKVVDSVSSDAKEIDVTDKLVMPSGVDAHAHIAGPKLCLGRLYRPEDSRRGLKPAYGDIRSQTGFSIPSSPATGYRYSEMGYGTVVEAAVPPLEAKHTHEELMTTPNLDIPTMPLFGNNWFVLQLARDGRQEELEAFISKWLKLVYGYGIKIVNPGGSEAWGWGMNVHGIDDPVPFWNVTSKTIIRALAQANENLGLPHSIHLHPNDLGHPGNFNTTIDSMKALDDIKKNSPIRNQTVHMTHMQYHAYGGTNWRDFESKADEVAKYINKASHVTCDLGQVTLDETTTMTADAPMEFDLFLLNGLKWVNKDIELETASGIVPFIYSGKNAVHSVQWSIGLELALLIDDPMKLVLSTDSPNAGPFIRYSRVMSWLMSAKRRQEMMENGEVHKAVGRKSGLGSIDREYDFYEMAQITRTSPAQIYGFTDRGNLKTGSVGDIAVYDINPLDFDPANNPEVIEKEFRHALYTFKDGQMVVKDGEACATKKSKAIWTNVLGMEDREAAIMKEVMPDFNKYYTVKFENYPVHSHYVPRQVEVQVDPATGETNTITKGV